MRYGFIHTDHLSSPISNLLLGYAVAAGSNLRPPFSIFDLTSGADGWALGSTICILHLLSPHFGPCCCSAICNPQSQSSIFSLEWGTGQEGSTGETWACPCERSARISSLNLLSLPQRSTGLAQRFPLLTFICSLRHGNTIHRRRWYWQLRGPAGQPCRIHLCLS